jgi:SAM-dependent methyltransferase
MKTSYTSSVHPDLEFEMKRLRDQALLTWQKELLLLRMLGLGQASQILEIGSGPGFVTSELLVAAPNSRIVCVEPDHDLIERARSYLECRGKDRVTFIEAPVEQAKLSKGCFDFVVVRMVLQHVQEPSALLNAIKRASAKDCRVVLVDVDDRCWGWTEPEIDGLEEVVHKRSELQHRIGGDRRVGGRLGRLLKRAGFSDLTIDSVAVSSDEFAMDAFLTQLDPLRLELLVQEHLLTFDDLDSLEEAKRQFIASENPSIVFLLFLASGVNAA